MKSSRNLTRYRGTRCLNCEHPLDISDIYCPHCGQLNSTKKLAFDDFFNEFFAGVFAYDSRLRRTLKALLFQPGKISQDYIQGKRMRYANPFKFYLSASIVFFILWSSTNDFDGIASDETPAEQMQNMSKEELAELRQDLSSVPEVAGAALPIDSLIVEQTINTTRPYKEFYITQQEIDSLGKLSSISKQFILYDKFHEETTILRTERALDSLEHDHSTYNKWLYKKVIDWNLLQKDPGIFIGYFVGKLPFIIFFFLPVLALFIWLLYVRRTYNYMEHLIFAFHVQTTFFVFMATAVVFDAIFATEIFTGLTVLLFFFYLYKAMRKFYKQKRFKTLVKFLALNGIFFILAIAATVISLLASFAIF